MIELLFAAGLLTAQPACAPPEGTPALLDRPESIIVIGESHGTTETPAAFAAIVCEASLRGPVTVGLEMPESDQPLLDFVLEAPDEVTAAKWLRGGEFGDVRRDDGRHSQAMFDMILSVWRLKAAGRDVALRAFAPRMSVIRGRDQAWWELEMAYGMSRALIDRPDARLMILVGEVHARKTSIDRFPEVGIPAAGHLYRADTLTLRTTRQGGAAWNCMASCGANPMRTGEDVGLRGVILEPQDNGAYDGMLALGPATASPPAAQSAVISSGSSA